MFVFIDAAAAKHVLVEILAPDSPGNPYAFVPLGHPILWEVFATSEKTATDALERAVALRREHDICVLPVSLDLLRRATRRSQKAAWSWWIRYTRRRPLECARRHPRKAARA